MFRTCIRIVAPAPAPGRPSRPSAPFALALGIVAACSTSPSSSGPAVSSAGASGASSASTASNAVSGASQAGSTVADAGATAPNEGGAPGLDAEAARGAGDAGESEDGREGGAPEGAVARGGDAAVEAAAADGAVDARGASDASSDAAPACPPLDAHAPYGPLTLFTPPASDPNPGSFYARAIELRHGPGCRRMYATFEHASTGMPSFPIYESVDGGLTWAKVSEVTDQVNGWGNRYQPFLYELPQAVGDLAAGTVLLAGNSIPSDLSKTKIDIYKSTDMLRTWTFVSSVVTGGRAVPSGAYDPVWEPFLMVGKGKLICYYSDETDPAHNQKIVHKTTTDGITWSPSVDDVAISPQSSRPGMPIVARMANGTYIMTFEIVANGDAAYFKTSADPERWDAPSSGTRYGVDGAPYVAVMGDGTIVATSNGNDNVYVNTTNAAGAWSEVHAPIRGGYSRALAPLSNGELFIILGGLVNATRNTVTYGTLVP